MVNNNSSKNNLATSLKVYFFPSLVTILAMMIWRDVSELRSDVKALLAQANIDKTKIETLEQDIKMLQQSEFGKQVSFIKSLKYDKYFKHEDFYDIKKYIILNEHKKVTVNKGKLVGINIVLSGFRDNELMNLIEKEGGIINNSLTKNTNVKFVVLIPFVALSITLGTAPQLIAPFEYVG